MISQTDIPATDCPDPKLITEYLLGQAPEKKVQGLESHFQHCSRCEDTIRNLNVRDTLSDLLQDAVNSFGERGAEDKKFAAQLVSQVQCNTRRAHKRGALDERALEITSRLSHPDVPNLIGELGPYQIESILGVGSTAVVFQATDTQLNRPVALKILRPSLGKIARDRFVLEARAAASIDHPNIVSIYSVGVEEGLAFIAMKWIEGESLESKLKGATYLSEDETRCIALKISEAIKVAHGQQMIHRDIKPANIWISAANGEPIILDFGLARVGDEDPHLTSTGMLAGTPSFMSPEQARGADLDGRSDLYSLGCVLYQCVTGKLPFGGASVLATLQAIQNECPAPPSKLNPHISSDFSDLVMCLLEKQPVNRPENAEQLRVALQTPREDWPFAATIFGTGLEGDDSQQRSTQGQTGVGRGSRIGWTAAFLLFFSSAAFGLYAFGPQIIRIATNQGELVIETEDKDIKVEILENGELIRVVDTLTTQSIDVQAGKYKIQVRDSGNNFEISPSAILMSRGGKQVVKISRNDKPESNANSPAEQPAHRDEPRFDGRTFDEWEHVARTELRRETVVNAIIGLAQLSNNNPNLNERAYQSIQPLLRKHGSTVLEGGEADIPAALNQYFSYQPPKRLVQIVLKELEDGTSASVSHVSWLLSDKFYFRSGTRREYESRKAMGAALAKEIRRRLFEIIDAASARLESDSDLKRIENLLTTAFITCFPNPEFVATNFGQQGDPMGTADQKTANFLRDKIDATSGLRRNQHLVYLARLQRATDEELAKVCQEMLEPETPTILRMQIYNVCTRKVGEEQISVVLPFLQKLFESDATLTKLTADSIRSGFGPTKFRARIAKDIGSFGKSAISCTDWLLEMREKYPKIREIDSAYRKILH